LLAAVALFAFLWACGFKKRCVPCANNSVQRRGHVFSGEAGTLKTKTPVLENTGVLNQNQLLAPPLAGL